MSSSFVPDPVEEAPTQGRKSTFVPDPEAVDPDEEYRQKIAASDADGLHKLGSLPGKALDAVTPLAMGARKVATAGFNDEIGGYEQKGLAWLVKHSPRIAKMLDDEYAAKDDSFTPEAVQKYAENQNRVDDRRNAEDNPKRDFLGKLMGGSLWATVPGMNSIAGAAAFGAADGVGNADEHRGLNGQTLDDVSNGIGSSVVGNLVGRGVGNVIGKVAGKFSGAAGRATQELDEDAARAYAKEVATHNGALGPPQAQANKVAERIINNTTHNPGLVSPALEAELQSGGPLKQKVFDTARSAMEDQVEFLRNYKPGAKMDMTNAGFDATRAAMKGGQIDHAMSRTALGVGKSIPVVKDAIEAGSHVKDALKTGIGSPGVRESLYSTLARASQTSADFMEKYGRAIMSSSAPEVTHQILQQRDPAYRQALREASEQGNGGGSGN